MKQPSRSRRLRIFASLGVLAATALGPGSAAAAPVAFVELPARSGELAGVIEVRRAGRPVALKGRYADLEAGDEIFVRKQGGEVVVRYLGNNQARRVRRSGASGQADYRVEAPRVASLPEAVYSWLVQQIVGSPGGRPAQEITASSRSTLRPDSASASCAASVDGKPAGLGFRLVGTRAARVAADGPPVVAAWMGGSGPYALAFERLHPADDGTATPSITFATAPAGCFARIDARALAPGRYLLTLDDASEAAPASLALEVVEAAPAMPEPLAAAPLDAISRKLYYATWLQGLDGGAWALEAQRQVLAEGCASPSARDWLAGAGLVSACP